MLLIIKRLKDEALMVRKDSEIDTIKDTIKLIQLLVTSLNGDKTLLSLGTEIRVSQILMLYLFISTGMKRLSRARWSIRSSTWAKCSS
jgi:hypothetical protein